jgi:hypothetical protein
MSGDSRDLNLINQKKKSGILLLEPIYLFTLENDYGRRESRPEADG